MPPSELPVVHPCPIIRPAQAQVVFPLFPSELVLVGRQGPAPAPVRARRRDRLRLQQAGHERGERKGEAAGLHRLRVVARGGDGDRVALLHGQLLQGPQGLRGGAPGVEMARIKVQKTCYKS